MPALDIDATYQKRPLDLMQDRLSITRSGSNIAAPFYDMGDRIARLSGSADKGERLLFIARFNPWLTSTLSSISEFRDVRDGWDGSDGVAPVAGSLDTAEMLAVYLNNAPVKPVFSVDALGRPTFSSNHDEFYVHLTVDEPNLLTLFAEVDGVEYFFDKIAFNGRIAPDQLSVIL